MPNTQKKAMNRSSICRILQKKLVEETGNVRDIPRSERQTKIVTESLLENIIVILIGNSSTAIRLIGQNADVSKTLIHRILKSKK